MFPKVKQNKYKTRQISGREIPCSHKFPRCHQVLSRLQIIVSSGTPCKTCFVTKLSGDFITRCNSKMERITQKVEI